MKGKVQNYNYVVVSPVRNEISYIEKTVHSIISQDIRPQEWIIVNDGSSDGTGNVLKIYSKRYNWIKVIDKVDRGFTQVGKGVIEAFNEGLRHIRSQNWDYIVKMDCDISFDKSFFSDLLTRMEKDNKLGVSGGTSFYKENNRYYEEKMPEFHPWAGARIYRRECFREIDGLAESLGWDTIDLVRAQMKGWKTTRYNDLRIIHLRRMSSRKGLWEGKIRLGRNFYITGYHPVFLIARSAYRSIERPYLLETLGVLVGYFRAMLQKDKLVVTNEEELFLRKQQIRRLFGGVG